MKDELGPISLTWNTVLRVAQDRGAWRILIEASRAPRHDKIK